MSFLKNNSRPIDTYIKIVALSVLLIWSFYIIKPFLLLIVWAIIVAVALYPLYKKVLNIFKNKKKKLVTSLFITMLLALIIIPVIDIAKSIVTDSLQIFQEFKNNVIQVPPPNDKVKEWPLVGEKIYTIWSNASANLGEFIQNNHDEIINSTDWIYKLFKGLLGDVALSVIALIIAGFFMVSAENGYKISVKFTDKLVSGKGEDIIKMCVNTIRGVLKGVLLVAIIQATFAFVGFYMIGLNSTAGILAIIVLFLAIIQFPLFIVFIPVIIYVFSFADTTPAIIFTIYIIIVSLLGGILNPLLLGKGLQTPMAVILLGSLGGMMLQGILGLFIGPVVLAILYKLYTNWVSDSKTVF